MSWMSKPSPPRPSCQARCLSQAPSPSRGDGVVLSMNPDKFSEGGLEHPGEQEAATYARMGRGASASTSYAAALGTSEPYRWGSLAPFPSARLPSLTLRHLSFE